jgi:radical SAM superfamily enzyme YgiQ (UPF0313 family)
VRTRNNPARGVKKNSDSGSYSGRRNPPYGILSIANYCRQKGHAVKLFDLFKPSFDGLSPVAIADQILSHHSRIVGISSMTSQSLEAMALGDALMRKSGVTVVHGGVHPAALPEEALKHGHFVVQGEGEHIMHEMLSSKRGFDIVDNDSNRLGRMHRGHHRILQGTSLTADEMDSIPFPRKKDYDETAFDSSLSSYFPIITARGCPYRCVFCKDGLGLRQSKVRYHSVDYVVDYLEFIYRTYGMQRIIVLDDIFLSSEERMEEMVVKLEQRNLRFRFQCQVHANVVKPRFMTIMRRLGIEWVYIGIESGNNQILKNIRKGTTVEKVQTAVHLLKRHGFYVAGMYMIGNIGETPQTVNDTIRLAFSLPTDRAWFSFAAPFPGTPFYDMVDQYGRIIEPDFGKWNQVSLVYLPKDISEREMHRLMAKAQMVRVYKKIRFSLLGCWTAPLKRVASASVTKRRAQHYG